MAYFESDPGPRDVTPLKRREVDDARRAVRTFRLKARRWVGDDGAVIETEAVAHAGRGRLDQATVVTVGLGLEPGRGRVGLQNYVHAVGARRPHSEVNASVFADLGADRQAPRQVRRLHRRRQEQKEGQRPAIRHQAIATADQRAEH